MATIRRHPVPADSYDPKRPLNDLLVAQLEHFKHSARQLPPEILTAVPAEPSHEDREGVDRFIAAVTAVHLRRKKAGPRLVADSRRRRQSVTLDLAASSEETPANDGPAESIPQSEPTLKTSPGKDRGLKP